MTLHLAILLGPAGHGKYAPIHRWRLYKIAHSYKRTAPISRRSPGADDGATAGFCGAIMLLLALQLRRSSDADKRAAHRLFAFSIIYLFLLFAMLLADAAAIHGQPT